MATPPVIVSTWKFGAKGNAAAYPALAAGGSALDAVERACTAVEDDLTVDSVGAGGLPDRNGVVSLDAAVMESPSRCGSVCFVRRYRSVASIARAVMEHTGHVMLVGEGAEQFAQHRGFQPANLLTDEARTRWEKWHAVAALADYQPYDVDADLSSDSFTVDHPRPRHEPAPLPHDTVGCIAFDAAGRLAAACSTSGLPFKLPGRVGDSPIIGSGLYVEPAVAAAVCTGTGELMLGTCAAYRAVAHVRAGSTVQQALQITLTEIAQFFRFKKQNQIGIILMDASGRHASASLRPAFITAVTDPAGPRLQDPAYIHLP